MKRGSVIIIAAVIFVLAGVGYWRLTGSFVNTPGSYDDFARCLTEKGVVMYGSKYCPHCLNQKEMFGTSFQYINYVECTEDSNLCTEKGITAVPAWSINGNLYTGEKTIQELSSLSGCELS